MNPIPLCPRIQLRQPIYIEQIAYLESCSNYTLVHLHDGQHMLLYKTIGLFDEFLPTNEFIRLNKTYIISLNLLPIGNIRIPEASSFVLTMGYWVEVGRRRVMEVKKMLEN